jgi:hypothetical protein
MRKIALFSILVIILMACGQQPKQDSKTQEKSVEVLSVDDLLGKASDLADKEIVVKGTVMHVCKHGGGRCFLMGSTEDYTIRIEAGEKIGAFNQEQMGSDLLITGILKEVLTEADAHNPGREHGDHGDEEHAEDEDTENAHNIIANNEDAAERVFFVEGISVKEI